MKLDCVLSNGIDLRTDPVGTLAGGALDLGFRGTLKFDAGHRRETNNIILMRAHQVVESMRKGLLMPIWERQRICQLIHTASTNDITSAAPLGVGGWSPRRLLERRAETPQRDLSEASGGKASHRPD